MEKINKAIEILLNEKIQNDSILDRLDYLNTKLKKLSLKEQAYFQRSEEELADLEKLEQTGLRSLFNKVIGNLDKAIEKERQEYLQAVLQHKSIEEEIEVLEYETKLLKKRFRDPLKIEVELKDLIKKKQFHLKSYDSSFTKELFKKESEIGRYKLLFQKAKHALTKAEEAKKIVNEIRVELLEVKDWPPSGKGKYASVAKKRYIDRARAKAIQAKVRLDEFGEHTKKLFRELEFDFNLDPLDNFLEKFYHNLITDFVIQQKLELTLENIDLILEKIEEAEKTLVKEYDKNDNLLKEKDDELKEFILGYELKQGT